MSLATKIKWMMIKLMRQPLCSEVEQFAYDFLDQKLDNKTEATVNKHLQACKNCCRFVASYRAVKEKASPPPPPPLDSDLKEMLYQFLIKQKRPS